ncbi:MAG: Na(+)/H(+) antiporter subunit B [Isosphaera sp.]|nr:Na(+)/H(+) antiporter subunit B [Isosphaera sp.]
MDSVILRTTTRLLLPVLAFFSIVVLLRGHNEPGGGFIGGLIAASGVALYAIAHGPDRARRLIGPDPRWWLGLGLTLGITSAIPGLLSGAGFFAGLWVSAQLPALGTLKLGTPIWFDAGVYVVVAASMLAMIFRLQEH